MDKLFQIKDINIEFWKKALIYVDKFADNKIT